MIDIWGRRGAFRQQQDLQNEGLRLRNETLRQNLTPDQGNAAAPRFIGGQFVAGGEDPSEAIQDFNDRTATNNATALMRQQMGSTEVSSMRGRADSAMGGGATELTLPGTSSGFRTSTQQERGALPPLSSAGNTREPRIMRSETPESYTRSLLDDTYEDLLRPGLRNGGMVMKPKMVKQPGYKNGGKVKIPGQDCAPGYEMGGQIGPEVTKWAGEKKKKKGMRGYAKSGKIGKVSEDDGMDTVDVRTREGEYLLNPETVEFLGGGDYQQGVRMLDETVMQATGEAPGPVPVNEEGEAMRGFRKGGKMGYAAGGVNPYPDPNTIRFGGVTGDGSTLTRAQRMELLGRQAGMRTRETAQNIRRIPAVAKNVVTPGALGKIAGAGEVVRAVGDRQKNQFYADPDVPWSDKALQTGREVADTGLRLAGGALGATLMAPVPIPGARIAGGVGGYYLGDQLIDNDGGALSAYRTANPIDAGQDEEPVETEVAPNQFYRPFSGGAVDLRGMPEQAASTAVDPGQMAVVQRTGGPDGEVIVREDVNGVPTFSNLRTAPQAGDAATLQAQADARVVEDAGIRATQNAVVDQMRENAPLYTQEQIDLRRAEQTAAAANAPKKQRVATDKRIAERFRVPQYDEDGKLEGYVEDQEKLTAFKDAMALLGLDVYALDEGQQDSLFEEFEPIYADIAMANSAARGQDRPISTMPRTGERALRRIPGSNITLGNVMGPEATLGDWAAGVFDGDPINDEFVQDPETGAIIPARRALRRQGDTIDARRKYGYLPPE
jgi:hypothetical protein